MEYKDVLDTMTGEYNNLTKSGRKAADYIFAHRVEAQYMSNHGRWRRKCGVAEATNLTVLTVRWAFPVTMISSWPLQRSSGVPGGG